MKNLQMISYAKYDWYYFQRNTLQFIDEMEIENDELLHLFS